LKVFFHIKLASFLNPVYEESVTFLRNLPYKLPEILENLAPICKEVAKTLINFNSCFILGKGFGEAIARYLIFFKYREIALKIKEVSYIHAEAYNAGTFKHGPIAMIDSNHRTPVIIIVVKDNMYDDMVGNYNQIKSRNATVVLLTNAKDGEMETDGIDHIVKIPNDGLLSSFYAVFAGQLIAYNIAIAKGFNPDKPRQLSKEITTK
jgi:glucosamine--fructose-6-phosphate aminotransferase (isomerizing)